MNASEEMQQDDPLMACLVHLARYFERPSDPGLLLAGLPRALGPLEISVFLRALQKAGLAVELLRRPIDELIAVDVPAVFWRLDGRPIVVEKVNGDNSLSVFLPEAHEVINIIDRRAIDLQHGFLSVRPVLSTIDPNLKTEVVPHWFWVNLLRHWRSHSYVILATVLINLLALGIPLFSLNVYDRVLPNKAFATLWILALGVAIGLLFDFLLRIIRGQLIDHVTRRLDITISSVLIERILNSRYSSRAATTGAMTQRLQEYDFVRDFFMSNTAVLMIDVFFSTFFVAAIAWIAWPLAFVPAIALLLMITVGLVVQRLMGQELAKAQYTSAHRQSLMVELVSGLETIKSVSAEGTMLRKWDIITREASFSTEKIKKLSSYATTLAYAMQFAVVVAIVIGGAYLFDANAITIGGIIACSMLAGRAVSPAGQLAVSLTRLRQAFSSITSLDQIMSMADERTDPSFQMARKIKMGDIEFRNVSFSYGEEGRKILNELSFRIKPGERVALLGRVGVGKTTVGRLLIRLYDVSAGIVLIDGIDLRQYHPHELRRAVTYVGQEADLFHGSLRENLLLAKPDASDEELVEAARLAGVDEFAAQHPEGYGLPVGERGNLLSSGQRHMVAIARAFLRRGEVIFLDDPTSSMDTATEKAFVSRLKVGVAADATLIITTHRNAVLTLVDRIIVLDGGRVVADGAVEDVMKKLTGAAFAAPTR